MKIIVMGSIAAVVLAAVLAAAAGCAALGGGRSVADASGRFSFVVGQELTAEVEKEGFYRYRLESKGIDVSVLSRPADAEEQGVAEALRSAGVEPQALVPDGSTSFGDWQARRWALEDRSLNVAMAYQLRRDTVYAVVVTGSTAAMPADPPAPVMRLVGSIRFSKAAGKPSVPETRKELEAYLRKAADAAGGSISLAAVRDGRIVYRYSRGERGPGSQASPDTAYHWGSMTKLVTAVAVMKLVESGQVGLDAPISHFLPVFSGLPEITVRSLLTHSSGLPDREARHLVAWGGERLPSLDALLAEYLRGVQALNFAPGSEASYSNWNYLALGSLIEHVTGKRYETFVTESVLRPLGMAHTAFRSADLPAGTPLASPVISARSMPDLVSLMNAHRPQHDGEAMIAARSGERAYLADVDIVAPWGGLIGPAEEAALFAGMHLDRAAPSSTRVLSPAALESMRRMQLSTKHRPLGWGLGWVVTQDRGEGVVEHAGGGPGIECLMRLYPAHRLGVVVMGNVNAYGAARAVSAAAHVLSQER